MNATNPADPQRQSPHRFTVFCAGRETQQTAIELLRKFYPIGLEIEVDGKWIKRPIVKGVQKEMV